MLGYLVLLLLTTQWTLLVDSADVTCSAGYDCVNSTVSSTDGFCDCSGYRSCAHASLIDANSIVYCGGSYSCVDSTLIQAPSVYCRGDSSCYEAATITADSYVFCQAWNACAKSSISITSSSSTQVWCEGDQSCAYAIVTAPFVYATGAYAMIYSSISSTDVSGNSIDIELSGYFAGYGASVTCDASDDCTIKC